MTATGFAALLAGVAALVLGLWLGWTSFDLLGVGLLVVVAVGLGTILRPSRLSIDRQIQPPRVPKGSMAIAFLTFANRGLMTVGTTVASQPFGATQVRTIIPRLRRGERGTRTYRLPTTQRGSFLNVSISASRLILRRNAILPFVPGVVASAVATAPPTPTSASIPMPPIRSAKC